MIRMESKKTVQEPFLDISWLISIRAAIRKYPIYIRPEFIKSYLNSSSAYCFFLGSN